MSNNLSTVNGVSTTRKEQVERCIEAFQAALNRGERPALEECLPSGAAAATALVELVHVELEFRLKHGEPARVEEYLARYPQLAGDPDVFADLVVAEYHLRQRREPGLRWNSYRERFPEHRDILAARGPDASQRGTDAATLPQSDTLERVAVDLPRLPGYEILSELGRGAMGVVYKARQIALHRTVALKMLHAARRSDAEQRMRFRNEVEIIARLQHPNIVQVHDVGEHDGRPFFAMEFLGGGSLADSFSGRPQPASAAAELIETLARAMNAVHAKGIVHRDLKPSNVVRTADGCPKITDFGLAHQDSSDLTVSGEVLGTPCYMAPEQAAGRARQVGPAADVYALGAILYELLTGRPPFRGASVMDLVRQVQDSDPVSPRRMEPRTPRDLETICLKCLRKEPGRRYPGAVELADDLHRFRSGESILARPPAWPERFARWVRRRPAVAVLLAAVVFIALAAPLGLLGHNFQLQKQRDRARDAEEQARRNETEARDAHFAADLKLASTLFNNGEVFQLPSLLEPYRRHDEADDDPRDFAWWYLSRHGQKARPALVGHDGPLHLLAYTPDGRELVTGGGSLPNQSLHVWNAEAGRSRLRRPLRDNGFALPGALSAYARSGALLAGATKLREVALWELGSGRVRFRLDHSAEVREVALSSNGHWLAVRDDLCITIWDCGSGRKRCTLPTLPNARLTFDPAGDLLMSGDLGSSAGVQWWDAPTGTLRKQMETPVRCNSLAFSPRGTFLLLIGTDGEATIWESAQCVPLHWSHEIGRVRSLAMSADEKMLAAGDETGVVRLWDVASCRWRARYRWQPTAIVALAFAPDNRTLSAATAEGQIHHLDATVRHTPDRLATSLLRDGPLAWSPDGETVAAGGYGGAVHLIDRRTARERLLLRCPVQDVRCLAFSPDGGTLATACAGERFVRLWNVKDGRQRTATPLQPNEITALAFCPDGRCLATVDDVRVRFWDAATGTARETLSIFQKIRAFAFTPDGRSLLVAGPNIQVWDISYGNGWLWPEKPIASIRTASRASHLALSRDGRSVATAEANGPVRLWRLSADRKLTPDGQAPVPAGSARALDFTPDGKSLFVFHSGLLDICSLWTPPARFCRIHLRNSRGTMNSAALSPDGRTIATVGGEGGVRLWDTSSCRAIRSSGQALGRVNSLTFSPDGRDLITASRLHAGQVHAGQWGMRFHGAILSGTAESLGVWDAARGREQPARLPSRDTMAPPYVLAGSPDGCWLAAGGEDGSIQIWDRKGKQWRTRLFVSQAAKGYAEAMELARKLCPVSDPKFRERSEPVAALTFSPDGRCLAASGERGSLRVWTIEGWTERAYWRVGPPVSPWIAFTPDSGGIAGSRGGQVCVWDARTGELRTARGAETGPPICCGAFLPGADVLALGSKDGVIRLWDRRTGEMKRLPGGHQDRIASLAFAADGKTLASGGWDRTVRLWNLRAGREVAVLEGHKGRIHAVAFSPDGKVLASGGEDGEFRGEVLLWRR